MKLDIAGLAREVKLMLIDSEAGQLKVSQISLKNYETGEEIVLAMTPERVSIVTGANFRSYNIVELGEKAYPKGERLMQINWAGILPSAGKILYPFVDKEAWDEPNLLAEDIERWKTNGDKIRLLITETPLNLDVYIKSFECEWSKLGDIKYEIKLQAAVDVEIKTVEESEEMAELGYRPRAKSELGRRISEIEDIYTVVKILTGRGSLEDVERIFGKNGITLDDFEPEIIIWG